MKTHCNQWSKIPLPSNLFFNVKEHLFFYSFLKEVANYVVMVICSSPPHVRSLTSTVSGSLWDCPGSPAIKASPSNAGGVAWTLGWGTKIPYALWPKS